MVPDSTSKQILHELAGDPLYQVNLLLWMLADRDCASVTRILYNCDFRLHCIEPPIPLPLQLLSHVAKVEIKVKEKPSPDLLIFDSAGNFVVIECKTRMFGRHPSHPENDSNQRQAKSFLLTTERVLASALVVEQARIRSCHIVYLARFDPQHEQLAGVIALKNDLDSAGLHTSPCGLMLLEAKDDGIYLSRDTAHGSLPERLSKSLESPILVQPLQDEQTDPRPLYFMPWMPSSSHTSDPYAKTQFGARVLRHVVQLVATSEDTLIVCFLIKDLLDKVTSNMYSLWKENGQVAALQDYCFKLIEKHVKKASNTTGVKVDVKNAISITFPSTREIPKVRDALSRVCDPKWLDANVKDLFSNIEIEF